MKIKSIVHGDSIRLEIIGDLNYTTEQEFTKKLMENIAGKNPQLEIDLSECHFMCSNAVGSLAAALMIARSHEGDVVLTGVSPHVKKLLEFTRLDTIIKIKGPE